MLERWTNQARNPLYASPLPLLFYASKMGPSDDPVKFVDGSRARARTMRRTEGISSKFGEINE